MGVQVVSKSELKQGVVVQVTTLQPRKKAVKTVIKTWDGKLAALGVTPERLRRYTHGLERYESQITTKKHGLLCMRVYPPKDTEPDQGTTLEMFLSGFDPAKPIHAAANPSALKFAALQINKAAKKLSVTKTQVILPAS